MQPVPGGVLRRARRRAGVVGVVLVSAAALTGCVEVPVSNPVPSPEPELAPLEELAAMPELPVSELQNFGEDVVAFLTEDRTT